MTRIQHLARLALSLRLADAPATVHRALRLQALSVLGASAAARHAEDAAPALRLAASSPGDLPLLPGVPRMDLRSALRAGPTLSIVHDHDDYLLCGHTGHSAVWGVWLLATARGLGWEQTLRAQLAVNEVLARLGGVALLGRANGQAWTFLHAAGGALASGLLRGLDERRLAHALALSLSSAPICDWRTFRGGGKAHLAAGPLRAGIDAAALAAEGAEGPLDLLDDGSDLLHALCSGRPAPAWVDGLDGTWLTETLAIKARPGCAYLLSAVEALEQVRAEVQAERGRPLGPDDILRIDVEAALPTLAMERLLGGSPGGDGGRLEPTAVNFSVARSLALLLVRGSLAPRDLRLAALAEAHPALSALAPRIRVHHDVKLSFLSAGAVSADLPLDRLLAGAGPRGLALALAERAPDLTPSLLELPVALASELAGAVGGWRATPGPFPDPARLPQAAADGIGRLAAWAGRQVDRLVPPPVAARPTPRELGAFRFVLPARVRVLLHGGAVREAEVLVPAGAPGRGWEERSELARTKLRLGYEELGAGELAAQVASDVLPPGDALPPMPGDGPGELLERLAG